MPGIDSSSKWRLWGKKILEPADAINKGANSHPHKSAINRQQCRASFYAAMPNSATLSSPPPKPPVNDQNSEQLFLFSSPSHAFQGLKDLPPARRHRRSSLIDVDEISELFESYCSISDHVSHLKGVNGQEAENRDATETTRKRKALVALREQAANLGARDTVAKRKAYFRSMKTMQSDIGSISMN